MSRTELIEERLTRSTYVLHKAAPRQLLSYLKATRLEVGLLLHFGPEPAFYRLIYRNDQIRRIRQIR